MRSDDASRIAMPVPGSARSAAMPRARRVEPQRAARRAKRELHRGQLDGRGDRRASVAQVPVAVLRKTRETVMTTKTTNATMPAVGAPRRPPVRVRLGRPRAGVIKSYPPDGETRAWWDARYSCYGATLSGACIGCFRRKRNIIC
jgi:hypothetical protein